MFRARRLFLTCIRRPLVATLHFWWIWSLCWTCVYINELLWLRWNTGVSWRKNPPEQDDHKKLLPSTSLHPNHHHPFQQAVVFASIVISVTWITILELWEALSGKLTPTRFNIFEMLKVFEWNSWLAMQYIMASKAKRARQQCPRSSQTDERDSKYQLGSGQT